MGAQADEILAAIRTDDDYDWLVAAAGLFAGSWVTSTGLPVIADLDLDTDTGPLLAEALKVLALKAAVFELTNGDEAAAELVVPAPVDEMVHAVVAQPTLVVQLEHRLGVVFVRMSDRKRFWWEPGDYTEQCYRSAGWGAPRPAAAGSAPTKPAIAPPSWASRTAVSASPAAATTPSASPPPQAGWGRRGPRGAAGRADGDDHRTAELHPHGPARGPPRPAHPREPR